MNYIYTFDDGKTYTDGKPEWADTLWLLLSRKRALQMIGELSRQLEDSEQEEINIFLPGKMEESKDE